MISIYLQHPESGQLAYINGSKLTLIRQKSDGFTMPGCTNVVYEVAVFENINSEYIEALCRTNISLAKKQWKEKATKLIHALIA